MSAVRCLVLALLVGQNSLYTLLRRHYSRSALRETVSSSVLLLAGEVLKFLISASLVEGAEPEGGQLPSSLRPPRCSFDGGFLRRQVPAVTRALRQSCPMAVPAVTYVIMNIISYKALEMIDATVFAMVAQMKIVSTALFAWPVLGRRQSSQQWRAILVLTLAVTIITFQRGSRGTQGPTVDLSATFGLGVGITLVEISLSGWITAYFEKYLKDGSFSVWGRNLQLSFWSMLIYSCVQVYRSTLPVMVRNGEELRFQTTAELAEGLSASLLGLLSPLCLGLVLLGGAGGLLVAFAIKYADSVLKAMATAFALVIVVAGEVAWLGAPADPVICMASGVAMLALQIYQDAPKAVHSPTPAEATKPAGNRDMEVDPLVVGRSG